MKNLRLPAEWEEQDGILLSWPHKDTDWAPILGRVEKVFWNIIYHITQYEKVILVVPEDYSIKKKAEIIGVNLKKIKIVEIPTNDTWARDYGPITIKVGKKPALLDFMFNGWGLKFPAFFDNLISQKLYQKKVFKNIPFQIMDIVFEGGSIESDGQGTILTTEACLLSPNRNPYLNKQDIEKKLKLYIGAKRVLWLKNGLLLGDDTDSHIDTLARLCPNQTICYVSPPVNKLDSHFLHLSAMEKELNKLKTSDGNNYRLIPLPFAKARYDSQKKRLPATYANFLIINNAVLVPTYEDPDRDTLAIEQIQLAFPERKIIGIDCLPLIEQHGSLHCLTMQIPHGVLK